MKWTVGDTCFCFYFCFNDFAIAWVSSCWSFYPCCYPLTENWQDDLQTVVLACSVLCYGHSVCLWDGSYCKNEILSIFTFIEKNTCPSGIPSFSYTESNNSNISYLIRNSFIILFFNSVTLEYESYQNVKHFPRHLKGAWLQSQVSLFPNLELAILVLSGIVQIYQRLWGSKISWIYMEYMLWLLKHLNCFTTKTLPLCNSPVNKVWSSLFRTE